MEGYDTVTLTRDVDAALVPMGNKVTLQEGEQATITQALGGSYTVVVNGNMFRIEPKDADALGKEVEVNPATSQGRAESVEELQKRVWDQMKTCYDPEIPVNVVDLGLIYKCEVTEVEGGGGYKADVAMTLTAPGCGMGDYLCQEVQNKLLCIEDIDEANVELVWDPPWGREMMSEAAQLQLGMY